MQWSLVGFIQYNVCLQPSGQILSFCNILAYVCAKLVPNALALCL